MESNTSLDGGVSICEESKQRIRVEGVQVDYYIDGMGVSQEDFEKKTGLNVDEQILPYIGENLHPDFFKLNGYLRTNLINLETALSTRRLWALAIHKGKPEDGDYRRELRVGVGDFPKDNPVHKVEKFYDFG